MVDFKKLNRSVANSIRIRKLAENTVDLVKDELHDKSENARFLEVVQELLPIPRVKAQDLPPLKQLEKVTLEFGKYKDKPLEEIPWDYLDWLCGSLESTVKTVKAYLTHKDLQREDVQHDSTA